MNGERHGYADGVTRKTRATLALLRSGPVAKPASATGVQARGATVMGAFAVGALAIGRLAIKRAAIEQLAVRGASLGRVEIDELVVRRLTVLEREPPAPPA